MQEYLTVGDAAKRLGVVSATVKLMARSGRLPVAARTAGGLALFSPADVADLAAARGQQGDRFPGPESAADGPEGGAGTAGPGEA